MISFQLYENPGVQIIIVILCNVAQVIFTVQNNPFKARKDAKMNMFVEGIVMVITYHLMLYSDWGPDLDW